jgi:bifunctional non-homologous end joining protein LigD
VAPGAGRLFVIHKHAARHLHWDLRLELDGVLRSWAVPKGPSYNPADKRLAVHVEDHPLEYGDFEGTIPEGNYGAGAVIVWDRGQWIPIGDPEEGLAKGKLLFELRGHKLHGVWTLVKMKKGEKEWLLIKERDAYASADGKELPQASVLSGLTVEDLKAGKDPAEPMQRALARLKAPKRAVRPEATQFMLAEPRDAPFSKAGWLFELKLDGYRILASRELGEARLLTRNGHDASRTFPEVAKAVAALPFSRIVLDGEVVVLDAAGHPSFQLLQKRGRLTRPLDVRRAAVELPVTYFVFDLLGFEDYDLRPLPLVERKKLLQQVLPPVGALRYLEHFEEDGEALYEQVIARRLEGIVGKRADSPYRSGRSPAWVKIRADRSDDFVVVGYTAPRGSRGGFGALHLADYVGGRLTYAGRVGSGFTDKQLREVKATLEAGRRPTPPCEGPVPKDRTTTWVEPSLVCEVRYKEWTGDGLLRHPVFLRFRDDKPPAECVRQGTGGGSVAAHVATDPAGDPDPGGATSAGVAPAPPEVPLTNLDKVFWPEEGYTKGDLIEYYRTVSPWLLPYLRSRPVVLTRYPDGIAGKSFFQKDAPGFAPEWIRTERMWSEQAQREIDYFICDDLSSLLYLINLGSIPLHVWASRVQSLEQPDWCILDLDPKGAPFTDVVRVALALRRLCERVELPAFVKTSGSSGLHVLIPLGRQCTYDQSRALGELLARVMVRELPEIATITRQVSRREGRVYVDYLQNGQGRLLVAPLSVRPLPGAPVSMPLRWSEVNTRLDIRRFTIRTAPRRLQTAKADPLAPVLDLAPDLPRALERLQAVIPTP